MTKRRIYHWLADRMTGLFGMCIGDYNPYRNESNWGYQRKWVEPHIKANDVVLDVGSGHLPCPRATVLADFFPGDTIHRSGPLVEDRPLVVCSVDRLPFLAHAFDFVLCSHVVEHVESPRHALSELARVAHGGYIETPAYGKDILVGTGNMHRWQVVEFEGTMHFFEYSQRQKEAHVTSQMMELWCRKNYHPWQDFFWQRQDLFNAWAIWHDGKPPEVQEYRRNYGCPAPMLAWKPVLSADLPEAPCTLQPHEIDLLVGRLATPDGRAPMQFSAGSFVDSQGSIVYPIRGKRIYCEVPAD